MLSFIDNKIELKDSLIVHADYTPVPESAWSKLCFWYGLDRQSRTINRLLVINT